LHAAADREPVFRRNALLHVLLPGAHREPVPPAARRIRVHHPSAAPARAAARATGTAAAAPPVPAHLRHARVRRRIAAQNSPPSPQGPKAPQRSSLSIVHTNTWAGLYSREARILRVSWGLGALVVSAEYQGCCCAIIWRALSSALRTSVAGFESGWS